MIGHICYGALENCYNPNDSYGEICVWCNCCGRVDRKKMWLARYETDKRHLLEIVEKINRVGFLSEGQQENIIKDISYYKTKLNESRKHPTFIELKCPKCNSEYTLYEHDGKIKCYKCDMEQKKEDI